MDLILSATCVATSVKKVIEFRPDPPSFSHTNPENTVHRNDSLP
jgi:hypothetical protein